MGGRRLPRKEALIAGALIAGLAVAAACQRGGAIVDRSTPAPPSATPAPTASPRPDPLGPAPDTADAAVHGLERLLAATPGDPCPDALERSWEAVCATGDFDGDGLPDTAYLVPLKAPMALAPNPAVVLVRRSRGSGIERFPTTGDADRSIIGRGLFGVADRTGDTTPELSFLSNECSARGCSSMVQVQHWDGTAWRDVGPRAGVDNIDRATMEGKGAKTIITMHGGFITGPGAGPGRASTVTYEVESARFQQRSKVFDPPVYLYHAILDADAKFDSADWPAAIQAYLAAIDNNELKDWRQEANKGEGRTTLDAYALFRIAVATAASGEKPDKAIDAVILNAKEEIFVNAALAFRKGFQEKGGVHAGCVDATTYLVDPANADYIADRFDYGYANQPRKSGRDMCPL